MLIVVLVSLAEGFTMVQLELAMLIPTMSGDRAQPPRRTPPARRFPCRLPAASLAACPLLIAARRFQPVPKHCEMAAPLHLR